MQPISIKNQRDFVLEGYTLPYSCYFADTPSYDDCGSSQETFKKMLFQWSAALSRNRKDGDKSVFPFLPDDEYSDALLGTIRDSSIILTRVELAVPGWEIDFDNFEDFIIWPKTMFSNLSFPDLVHEVDKSKAFELVVDVDEFIQELKNPQVVNVE